MRDHTERGLTLLKETFGFLNAMPTDLQALMSRSVFVQHNVLTTPEDTRPHILGVVHRDSVPTLRNFELRPIGAHQHQSLMRDAVPGCEGAMAFGKVYDVITLVMERKTS